jgi:ATP-dependent DNA helicase RecG
MQKEINTIIKTGEDEKVEFKSAFNKELIETIVAFANSKGGSIFIGVSEKGKIVGVSINDESIQNWINEIKTKTSPEIIPDVEIYSVENKAIVELIVKEYPLKPIATQGRYFKRAKNSNHLMSVDEVSNMHLQTINSSWDAYPDPLHSVKDISIEKVKKAISELKRKGKFVDDDTNVFLSKYNLIRENNLTFGGYLMFKKEDCFLSTIELGRFQDDITIKDSDRTKSDLITQVEDVFNFVKIQKNGIIHSKQYAKS